MATDLKRTPFINAPMAVTVAAATLGFAHVVRILAPERLQTSAIYHGALFPERFWSWATGEGGPGNLPPYTNLGEALFPLVASGFLHGDIMHVVLNALFLVALGKPIYEIFRLANHGRNAPATGLFLAVAMLAQVVGGLFFLALQGPYGGPGIGSSGAVSGLLGAVLLVFTGRGQMFRRPFLTASAIFVVANAVFAFIGPSLLGASIAWETHVGGYIAGAVAMRVWLSVSGGQTRP